MSFAGEVTGHNRDSHYPFLSTMTLFETPFYRVEHTTTEPNHFLRTTLVFPRFLGQMFYTLGLVKV